MDLIRFRSISPASTHCILSPNRRCRRMVMLFVIRARPAGSCYGSHFDPGLPASQDFRKSIDPLFVRPFISLAPGLILIRNSDSTESRTRASISTLLRFPRDFTYVKGVVKTRNVFCLKDLSRTKVSDLVIIHLIVGYREHRVIGKF